MGRCFLDVVGSLRATTTTEQAETLEQVRLTDEDAKMTRERGIELKVIYQLRCNDPDRQRKFEAAGRDHRGYDDASR